MSACNQLGIVLGQLCSQLYVAAGHGIIVIFIQDIYACGGFIPGNYQKKADTEGCNSSCQPAYGNQSDTVQQKSEHLLQIDFNYIIIGHFRRIRHSCVLFRILFQKIFLCIFIKNTFCIFLAVFSV